MSPTIQPSNIKFPEDILLHHLHEIETLLDRQVLVEVSNAVRETLIADMDINQLQGRLCVDTVKDYIGE